MNNWRPADLVETAVAWENAATSKTTPTCLIFSRQGTSAITRDKDQIESISNGGYLLESNSQAQLTLVASGSEVQLALDASKELENDSIKSNIVSMPSLDKFLEMPEDYQNKILNSDKPILVVECSHPNSWYKILNRNDKVLGIETFGESAPASILLEHFGFNVENVVKTAKSLIDE